jgi:GNAT superfamily N-acetyltransferase
MFCLWSQGICGIEVRLVNRAAQAFVPRASGEAMMASAMAGLGPKQRRLIKDLSLVDQVAGLLPDEYDVVPLMANLVVDTAKRRGGVGLALYTAAQETCAAWGFDTVWLQVEATNAPARKFYESVQNPLA